MEPGTFLLVSKPETLIIRSEAFFSLYEQIKAGNDVDVSQPVRFDRVDPESEQVVQEQEDSDGSRG